MVCVHNSPEASSHEKWAAKLGLFVNNEERRRRRRWVGQVVRFQPKFFAVLDAHHQRKWATPFRPNWSEVTMIPIIRTVSYQPRKQRWSCWRSTLKPIEFTWNTIPCLCPKWNHHFFGYPICCLVSVCDWKCALFSSVSSLFSNQICQFSSHFRVALCLLIPVNLVQW